MEREVGGGIGMGNTCKPMAVSFQCMTKFTTNKRKKKKALKKKKKEMLRPPQVCQRAQTQLHLRLGDHLISRSKDVAPQWDVLVWIHVSLTVTFILCDWPLRLHLLMPASQSRREE